MIYENIYKKKDKIKFIQKKNVFVPNQTTKLILKSITKQLPRKRISILDLGCGNGFLGIILLKNFKNITKIVFCDSSKEAILNCKQNLKLNIPNSSKYEIYQSNLFENLDKEKKFDIIINDVSGISQKLTSIFSWFKKIPCETGSEGINLNLKILSKFKKYLKKNGKMYMPIISLSNEKKLISFIKKKKLKYKELDQIDWPLPKVSKKNKEILNIFKKKNYINFTEKYRFLVVKTKIIEIYLY